MVKLYSVKSVFIFPLIISFLILIHFPYQTLGNFSLNQTHKVTIAAINIPLEDVFNTIHKQTGFTISNNFTETKLSESQRVTVNFKQTDINEVMSFLLSDNQELTFSLRNKIILIYKNRDLNKKKSIEAKNIDSTIYKYSLSGKIIDITGTPVPGATIKVKNTRLGTISAADGAFHLNIRKGETIIITALGFESSEMVIKNETIIAKLKPYISTLDEKVVIAYGSTTKRFNTGNIGSVKAKDIQTQPVNNPLLALQGRVAGVYIEQASGLPGTGISINIQGTNSISSGNDPFFVIDGVPYMSQLLQPYQANITRGNSAISGNPLNYINPADIESIEILKDADATAIYGSRAANGAVLITTKRGKVGPLKVDLSFQNGWGKVAHKLDVLNAEQYLAMRHEALKNDGITSPQSFDYDLNGVWDTTQQKDWQKELIGGSALYRDAQLSISGGSELTQYLISGGYHKETSVFPGNFSDTKGNVHFNLRSSSKNQKLKLQLSGIYSRDNNELPQTDLTAASLELAPVAPSPLNQDGSLNWQPTSTGATSFRANPLVYTKLTSKNRTTTIVSQSMLSYDITPWLLIKSSFGLTSLRTDEMLLNPASAARPEVLLTARPTTTFAASNMDSWVIEPQIEFNKAILKGKLNALIGSTIQQNTNSRQTIDAAGFNNDLVMEDIKSATTLTARQSINETYKYNALYGRINYNLLDKYIINISARRDGSSRFGPRNQFHNFGAIGVGWIFSQTSLVQQGFSFLSFGKLRASYGTTGNDQIAEYQFLDLYNAIPVDVPYQRALGLTPNRLYNPDLQWESTKKLQAGLELGFYQDKILFNVNYNRNRSSNQLFSAPLASITGFSSLLHNIPAIVQNTGWEFTVNTINIKTKNFSWTSSFNLTIPKNKLVSFIDVPEPYFIVGKSVTTIHSAKFGGLNSTTGLFQFLDSKGNITDLPTESPSLVNNDPYFYGGFQNSFYFKGFSLDIFFQFTKRTGADLSYGYNIAPGQLGGGLGNQPTTVLDRWQIKGDQTFQQQFSTVNTGLTQFYTQFSDAPYTDIYFIKLKNIALSWQIPDKWRDNLHLQNLKLFILAQNVFTITDYFGMDPESRGIGLPPLRVITLGGQVSF